MNPRKWRVWHRWLSLIVGLQLVVWSISGAYMVYFDLSFIHGNHLVKELEQPIAKNTLNSPISWVLEQNPEATSVRLIQQWIDGSLQPVYSVESKSGTQLLKADSLEPIELDRMDIGYIARQHYTGDEDTKAQVSFIEDRAPGELNPALLPVWRVDFNDMASATLYFSAATGELVTKRHDFWRMFDFFWMLHIMDYQDRVDIETWWLKAFSIANGLFLISGIALLYFHYRPRKKKKAVSMRFMRKLHRWLSLVIFIQVFIWLVSGLYFSWLGHQKLAAHDYFQPVTQEAVGPVYYPENALIERFENIQSLEVRAVAGTAQYVVTTTDGKKHYVNALTGKDWKTSAPLAAELARQSYNGPGRIEQVHAVTGSDEIIGWQSMGFKVTFSDDIATRAYIDAASAEVLDHRNNSWWLSDWMFRLHFMDYSGERDFNSLLNIVAATAALWFSLSGLILLARSLKRRQLF